MKKIISRIIRVVLIVTIPFIIFTTVDFLTEITGGSLGEYLQKHYNIDKKTLFFLLLGLLLLALTYEIYQKWQEDSEKTASTPEDIESNIKLLFDSLKERYQKRFDGKLDGRFEITLEVNEDWRFEKPRTYKFDAEAKVSDAMEAVSNAFDEQGRLLIVGSPGSGKTVLLLKLALELLDGEYQTKRKIPVIFNLASWNESYEKFGDWLIDVLKASYVFPKGFLQTLLDENRIIFLLDGLDELARNEDAQTASGIRAKCLESLESYMREGRRTVICCRRDEFAEMQTTTAKDAPVRAKVEVLDLTEADIILALQKAKKHNESRQAAEHLEEIIETNETFLQVLSTPFYFTTALEVFDEHSLDKKDFPKDTDGLKNYLKEKFVVNKIRHSTKLLEFENDEAQIRKWLKWLARLMEKKQLVVFELADLQPSDLVKRWHFGLVVGLVNGLLFGLIVGLIVGLLNGLLFGLVVGLVGGLIVGLYVGLMVGLFGGLIGDFESAEIMKMDISVRSLKKGLIIGLIGCIFVSLFSGIFVSLIIGLIGGIFISLSIGVIIGLLIAVESLKKINTMTNINTPYERVMDGFWINLFIYCLFSLSGIFLLIFLDYYLFDLLLKEDQQGLFFSALLGVLTFPIISILETPFLKHLYLRLSFWFENLIPVQYATFLDLVAKKTGILEKDGGQWRFRHQNLQDYIAEKE